VGNGGDVLNDGNLQSDGLHGADGGLTAGTGALHTDFDFLQTVTHGLTAGILGDHLGGIGCALTGALETHLAGTGPAKNGTAHVGDADDRVVEGRLNVGDAVGDIFASLGLDDLGWLDRIVEIKADRGCGSGLLDLLLLALLGSLGLLRLGGSSCLGRGSGGYGNLGCCRGFRCYGRFFGHELGDVLIVRWMMTRLILGADDTHGLAGSLAGTGIGLGTLTTDGKTATMAETTVAVDCLQTLEVTLKFAAEVTLDDDLLGRDGGDDGTDLLGRKFLGAGVGIDVGLLEDALGGLRADAVNVNERGFNALVAGDFYAEESWHGSVGSSELGAGRWGRR